MSMNDYTCKIQFNLFSYVCHLIMRILFNLTKKNAVIEMIYLIFNDKQIFNAFVL